MALANPLETFVWGAGGARKTPDQIAREREIAEALMAQGYDTSPVGHWAEGLARMANVASGKIREGRAERAEQENATASQQRIASMLGGMGGSASAFPAAPAPAGGAAPTAARPNMGDVASNRVAAAHAASALPGSFLSALDMHEGGGDYDTLFGHAQRSGPFAGIQVSTMPISDVLAFADPSGAYGQHVKGQVGRVATPMGRHQIVGTTLRNAVGELGLDPSTPFNAQTQDTIAAHLARRRIQSASTTQGKIAALRSEWEGFKNVPDAQMVQIVNDLEAMPAGGAVAANEAMASGQMAGGPTIINPDIIGGAASAPPDPNIAPEWATNPNMGGVPPVEPTALAPIETLATEPMAAPMLTEPKTVQDRPVAPVERVAQAMFPMEEMAGMNPRVLPSQGSVNPAVMEALSNPYASDAERQIAGVLLEQQMSQQQAEQERMRAQQEAQIEMQRRQQMATELGLDPRYANDEMVYEQAIQREFRDQPTDIREYEYARQQGYPGTFAEFQAEQRRAGATNITTNVGEGSKFYDELDKSQAGTFGALAETGVQARSKMAQIDRLEGLLTQAETGGLAMLKQAAGEYGIATEGLSDIQAAQALINELVPQQRQPGSGPMSDADLALFKQSLPRLINQPGGNQTIINTMRGITQYQIQMGEIADAVADRQLTPAQAREQIRNLPNPLAGITAQENRQRNRTSSGVEWSIEE